MQTPVRVTFRDLPVSDAVEQTCWEEAEKLERYHDRIVGCRVVVAQPHRRHLQGNLFEVRIDLEMPGGHVVVNRVPPQHQKHEDVHVAVQEAFRTTRRRLEDFVRRQRGDTKAHRELPEAVVVELALPEGYGFLETAEGRRLYFHGNSVPDGGFEGLEVGARVRFREEQGVDGPQASFVALIAGAQPA